MVAFPAEPYLEGFSWLLFWQRLEPTIKIHFKVLQSESSESPRDSVAGAVQDQGFSPIPN